MTGIHNVIGKGGIRLRAIWNGPLEPDEPKWRLEAVEGGEMAERVARDVEREIRASTMEFYSPGNGGSLPPRTWSDLGVGLIAVPTAVKYELRHEGGEPPEPVEPSPPLPEGARY